MGTDQTIGLGNLTKANQQKFAEILAWTVEAFGLDGIDFDGDDGCYQYGENSNFTESVEGSFSGLIIKFRDEFDERFQNEHKLITVLDMGYATQLTSEAVAACDFGWYPYVFPNVYASAPYPWTNSKWSAQVLPLNTNYNALTLFQVKNRSTQSKNDGMGAIATYNLQLHTECDPLPVLQKIGEGAFTNVVTRSSTPSLGYAIDWSSENGTAICYDDIY